MRESKSLIKEGINIIPNVYNAFFSKAKLSDKRKEDIALRRDNLKVREDDSSILRIVIEELLSYKPRFLTLDDRYLQLEKILDAIDKARADKDMDKLILVCSEIYKELSESPGPGHLKNALLECLCNINLKIESAQSVQKKAKL